MKIVLFYHSLTSDWNNGNAHFLRGVATELQMGGHDVEIYEPADGWSLSNLRKQSGETPIREFRSVYPHLKSTFFSLGGLDLDRALDHADLVIVHEWNELELIQRVCEHRALNNGYRLLFHDTHHRAVTAPRSECFALLSKFDGVLAYGEALRQVYLSRGWTRRVWTWHEAADVNVFHPIESQEKEGDLVWVGNWGDEERTEAYQEFLLEPIRDLRLRARAYGVRYPETGIRSLEASGMAYAGWLPNFKVPEIYSRYRVTLHIPRRPYLDLLPGIPTIRPFEALACGIPLICSPWRDEEALFTEGEDYLIARNGEEMKRRIRCLLNDPDMQRALSDCGRKTILDRHTCGRRVDELMAICADLGLHTQTDKLRKERALRR